MMIHHIEPVVHTLHGHFSRDLALVLTIESGDTVRYRTLDAGWSVIDNPDPFERPPKFPDRDSALHPGHALCGPVAIQGAKAGMTLEVHLKTIRTGTWGWSAAGFWHPRGKELGLPDKIDHMIRWRLDADVGVATTQDGMRVQMRPFMGVLGMPPNQAGQHSTVPPRFGGGNIDCKELIVGSRLFLPVEVDGGLFSIGDGHAVQGDGEVAGPALECPMELVEVEFFLHPSLNLSMPRANTPAGWIAFGFDKDLDVAMMVALNGMLDIMEEVYAVDRAKALALASLVVDLRISQIVNGVRGVHAILPHDAITTNKET